jgi:crotonobetainyl-CoA:carnitine CoA-transferase CaiB-like acyl-CoA transferase
VPMLDRVFKTRVAKTWVTRCRAAAITAALVRGVREALDTPDAQPLIASIDHPLVGTYSALRNPLRIDGARLPIGAHPPLLGEHTDRVLRELGYAARDIARLRRDGVIGGRPTSGKGPRNRRG